MKNLFRFWSEAAKCYTHQSVHKNAEQHTTLRDINDVGVYEGDILLIRSRADSKSKVEVFTGDVRYINGSFQCVNDQGKYFTLSALFNSTQNTCKVIGNIHS